MRIQSDREYARQRAAVSPATQWTREAEVWFDGTVESVDRRLAMCRRVLAGARTASLEGITEKRLATIGHYEQQHVALEHLRRQLLTAGSDREAAGIQPGNTTSGGSFNVQTPAAPGVNVPIAPKGLPDSVGVPFADSIAHGQAPHPITASLHHKARRWVALEAAKFYRANAEVDDEELRIRAANHAELATGALDSKRSRDITAAFVGKVHELRQMNPPRPVTREASQAYVSDIADEWLFM